MKIRRYVMLYVVSLLCCVAGFVYGRALVQAYREMYKPRPVPEVIPTPKPVHELQLPEVDMSNARELLPREIDRT